MFSYENFAHEAGFGRLAISIIALLILLIPYRRGERWAFAALTIPAVVYYVPVFLFGAIPNLGTWPVFRTWNLPQQRVANLAWQYWSVFLLTSFLILGLAMSAPVFFRKKGR
jgi:cell division protein FtsW (lipid II flippase)